ncbi:hypothetical protein KM043_008631 [Ampulex compressa]|nr:hypothetical protein KM043_008631 [Ampulex compressa]
MKRVRIKYDKPNPLFELWLEQWMNEAVSKNSDLRYHFSRALESLKKYPLPLRTGKDCIILQHFGSKLCSMLDKKLLEHEKQNSISRNEDRINSSAECNVETNVMAKIKYKRVESSETEVELILDHDTAKDDKIARSGLECDTIVSLIDDKSPCKAQKSPKKTSLAFYEKSIDRVENLNDIRDKSSSGTNNISKEESQPASRKVQNAKSKASKKLAETKEKDTLDSSRDFNLEANNFDVILLVDTQETRGGKTKPQHDATVVELTRLGVLFEIRRLHVGDFAWIARCRCTSRELVLPYIVERKRIDDLSSSIKDGRFHEQKFRLKRSGITNLLYVIEDHESSHRLAIPHSSLMQAGINSSVHDGFSVKYTRNHKDSMFYLSCLTRILSRVYTEKHLTSCRKENLVHTDISKDYLGLMEFNEFNKASCKQKNFKVNQMFVRQLLQLKGLSVDKAAAIVDRFPTPRALIDSLCESGSDGESLLANIQYGRNNRLIGPALSKTICQLYTRRELS